MLAARCFSGALASKMSRALLATCKMQATYMDSEDCQRWSAKPSPGRGFNPADKSWGYRCNFNDACSAVVQNPSQLDLKS